MPVDSKHKKVKLADLGINYSNKDSLKDFVEDNIQYINSHIGCFNNTACNQAGLDFDSSDIKTYLREKFINELSTNVAIKDVLWKEFIDSEFAKNKIKEIATNHHFYKNDVEDLFKRKVFEHFLSQDRDKIIQAILKQTIDSSCCSKKKGYYTSVIRPALEKSLFWAFRNGFSANLKNMESGLMTANAGDSAQFLFLARAILAGYNCSNVDVRSSRYDAVIDQNDKLFRVQIKGITSGTTIAFKDRNRGGKGIDSTNAHNQGKRITSKDCDIYVAVDKQFGICYIIPTSKIDEWNVDSKSVKELDEYRENWKVIDDLGK